MEISRMTSLLDKIDSSLPLSAEPVTKWRRFYDPATSGYYFFNTEDESTQWEVPKEWRPRDVEVAQVYFLPAHSYHGLIFLINKLLLTMRIH